MPKHEKNVQSPPKVPLPAQYHVEIPLPEFPITQTRSAFSGHLRAHLHTHDTLEIAVCIKGSGVFQVGGKVLPYRDGDVAFIHGNSATAFQQAKADCRDCRRLRIHDAVEFQPAVCEADGGFAEGVEEGVGDYRSPETVNTYASIARSITLYFISYNL